MTLDYHHSIIMSFGNMPIVSTADYTWTILIVSDVDMARMSETEKETGKFACEKDRRR